MKCLFLVAGYATRLFPLTENQPKALLEIGGKAILDYVLAQVNDIDEIDEIIVISNNKFFPHFSDWAASKNNSKPIIVLNDNTMDDATKLGAIGDIDFAIDNAGINDDLMILAGDNLFTFRLVDFYNFFVQMQKDCITVHRVDEKSELQRMGVAQLDDSGKVIGMEEKPKEPKSNTAVDPFYIYKKSTLPLIKKYLADGNNPDAPGNFPSWLYKQHDVLAHWIDGFSIDIGTVDNYKYVNENFDELFEGKL